MCGKIFKEKKKGALYSNIFVHLNKKKTTKE